MKEPRDSNWFVYPQVTMGANGVIKTGFEGLITQNDPTYIPDSAASAGQNTFDTAGDHFAVRSYGTTIFPSTATVSVASGGYKSSHTFRLRDGSNIMVVSDDSNLYFFDELSQTFVNLISGMSSGDYGFAEFNVNANAESRLYFGNGVGSSGWWNGGHTLLNGALTGGEAVINVDSTASFTTGGSGSIRINGVNVSYTNTTPTSFTGCVGTPAASDNTPVCQAVTFNGSIPIGNIFMSAQNRLFIVPTANQQIIQFCAYGDSTTWLTTTVQQNTATSAGAFNLVEGGGRVTAMSQDELNLYFYKDSMIYVATLTDSYYSLKPFKPFDGRSRAVGAKGKRGVFVGGNYTFVVTPDNQIKALQRIQNIDYPQLESTSYPIQPTCDALDFSSVTGISFKQYAFFACKSTPDAANNDTVLVYNAVEDHWETPIVGWQVGEWMVYNDGSEDNLYFTDAVSPNIWKCEKTTLSDGVYPITASRSTKQYDFGLPSQMKEFDDVYVEGYITPNTTLRIRLLLDEKGYTDITQTDFSGKEVEYQLYKSTVNSFGLTPFGHDRFGSNDDLSGLRKFRVHLKNKLKRVPFYVAQLEFSSSGTDQRWEVVRYGFLVRTHSQPTRTKLMRDFS